ncbi:MAG: rhomboid family intramembrane serine protease [Acidobacteria bacterium]|nr:rhomboid family intramembrane serine protease [Acidobacteriota bacterium]MDA1236531.1 rhomboid family intramembrane serine protease [Acidobacteriota bacterium]
MAANRMCPNCRAFVEPSERICPYCETELHPLRRKAEAVAGPLSSFIPDTHFTTVILLAINFGLFIAMLLLNNKLGGDGSWTIGGQVLQAFGAKSRIQIVVYGEWWRLITAGFLHGSVLHILMNSWVLFDLGAQTERVFGTARYLVIYLLSSVGGFYLSYLMSYSPSVGSSAALAGLIGAMMAFAKRTNQSIIWSFYLRWVLILAVFGLLIPGIDNYAHLGGLIAGFLIGWVAASSQVNREIESLWKTAATVCCLVATGALAFAYTRIVWAL